MLRLRTLAPDDLLDVLRVQGLAYRTELLESSDVFALKMKLFPRGALGMFDEDRVVAYLFCHPWTLGEVVPLSNHRMKLPEQPDCLYIHDLAVDPEQQGRGVGDALVNEAFSVARALGLRSCALVAVQSSTRFWERHGFVVRRQLEYRPGVAAHYMVKDLR